LATNEPVLVVASMVVGIRLYHKQQNALSTSFQLLLSLDNPLSSSAALLYPFDFFDFEPSCEASPPADLVAPALLIFRLSSGKSLKNNCKRQAIK
jgi:hypothetical protein